MKIGKSILLNAALAGMMVAAGAYADEAATPAAKKEGSTPAAKAAPVEGECHGVNTCKGTGACGGKDHACHGKNTCKGKGWLKLSKEDCTAKGGTFQDHHEEGHGHKH